MTIAVKVPLCAIVGRYQLFLKMLNDAGIGKKEPIGFFYVLFNPWVQGDEVFLPTEEEREEYVLNDTGLILYGHEQIRNSRPWDFGQFEEDILDITLYLLDQSLDLKRDPDGELLKRSGALHVSRTLCAMVNHHNENTVFVGSWIGGFINSVVPSRWNGSVQVLRSWRQNGPVPFGQCWVSAGVLCTMLRCLGIPTRLVTIFDAARRTDAQFYSTRFFFENGIFTTQWFPSVWNFHTLIEVWIRRKELNRLNSDWQVLDTDSGDSSRVINRLGPASLRAIRDGDVELDYDTAFLFAELNCQICEQIDLSKRNAYTNIHSAGQFVGTKALGALAIVDVTDAHKYPEGTQNARDILTKARNTMLRKPSLMSSSRDLVKNPSIRVPKPDFTGSFEQGQPSRVGEDVDTTLSLKNTNDEAKVIQVNLAVYTMAYTKIPLKEIVKESLSISLGPDEEKKIPYTIKYSQYRNGISNDNLIQFVAVCFDNKEGSLLTHSVATLLNPPLLIKVCGNPIFNVPLPVEILFSNPLEEDVANCHLVVEGSGLLRKPVALCLPIVKSKQTSVTKVNLLPYRAGPRILLANFNSDKFHDIKAYQEITIPPLHIN
ncbi:protein-glutamine gamma-glutamyltransferase E-like [Pelobates fuscus]|uniref:protein-glutamine gamma-glutamyltransferase E-like n=1 Tax=Pelobates fuscus TaxID=191477 RepID=UPI002FE45492